MKHSLLKFFFAVLVAGFVSDAIHIYYGHQVADIAVYNSFINSISFFSKGLEALGIAIIYYLLGDQLYFDSKIMRGLVLAILVCLIKDGLIRQPIMNALIGNSIADAIARESQVWLSNFAAALVITFMVKPKCN